MTTLLALRPLSARSVVLSLLLGVHPAELSAAALVRAGDLFDVPETTLRAAVSRMVSAGDLVRDGGTYRLSERLLDRQRRQDEALRIDQVDWDGAWEQVVITSSGRSAADRAGLRSTLAALRLAELREGVWLRPANLARPLPAWPDDLITTFRVTSRVRSPSRSATGCGTSRAGPHTVATCWRQWLTRTRRGPPSPSTPRPSGTCSSTRRSPASCCPLTGRPTR